MKKLLLILGLILNVLLVFAHVGSSGVVLQGEAGAYRLLVDIQPPDVIPGTARVTVYVERGDPTTVKARPIYFRSGDEGAPDYEAMEAVAGQPGQFQGIVWLMENGSSSVQIKVEGTQGSGEMVVPLVAVSTAQRDMPAGLGWTLGALGLLLVILLITVIGASVSDGLLRAGQTLSAARKRKRLVNMGIAFVACVVILYGGSSWWDSWAADYRRNILKPLEAKGTVVAQDGQRLFQLKIDTTTLAENRGRGYLSYLVPDHGKMMHLFLVRAPGLDAFAHLHPERVDSTTFQAYLPKLPAGRYLVYGDIFSITGFTETITDTIDIPEMTLGTPIKRTDPEDTYVVTDPLNEPKNIPLDANVVICGKPGTRTALLDGSYVVWEGQANQVFKAGKPYQLKFEVFAPDGAAAQLQPYLGMAGHAAVVRSDGSVYVHLHPVGTVAMASELSLKNRIADTSRTFRRASPQLFRDSIDRHVAALKAMPDTERENFLMKEMGMKMPEDSAEHEGMNHGSNISFPYAFPRAGQYRIFLQIKRNGQVLTGIFDARVEEAEML
ncbi:hypothetical protein [Persicitalea sp.]|uniref:hypothetical protein n=1 Tax=Persicitalea sp. TaxID=3100273 RepID=UPI0035939548